VSRTTWVSLYQKGKTRKVKQSGFIGARGSERQWHQLGHIQICTWLQTDNHASIPPLSFFTGRIPFLLPDQQRQSTEGKCTDTKCWGKLSQWFCLSVPKHVIFLSVLRCCWLGSRKGIRPVKHWLVGCWHGYLSGMRCRFAYGPADPIAADWLLLQEIQICFGFTSVRALPITIFLSFLIDRLTVPALFFTEGKNLHRFLYRFRQPEKTLTLPLLSTSNLLEFTVK